MHLPEILGEGLAPDSRGVVIQEREREELLKRQKANLCGHSLVKDLREPERKSERERNRKFNYHEAHLKLNLRRSDPTAGD